jgi:nickel-type superoxide dismutase maturation protease
VSRLLTAALVAAGIAYCCLRWRPSRVEIRGSSMAPLLWAGDWALTVPARRVAVGDVVVIEHPHRPGFEMVKRIVAAPGDLDPSGDPLGADGWWVEGDNPDESTDSRHFGPLGRDDILAHVMLVYWPPHRRRLL